MSNYTQTTFFTPKDSLPLGNPSKLVVGAAYDVEFGNISTAIATKYDSASIASNPVGFFTGSVAAPAIYLGTYTATGFYLAGANSIGLSINGSSIAVFAAGTVTLNGTSIPASATLATQGGANTFSNTCNFTGTVQVAGVPLSQVPLSVNTITANYTVASSDCGGIISANANAITITLPNTLPVGFVTVIRVRASDVVTLAAGSGATLNWANGTNTAGNRTLTGVCQVSVISDVSTAFIVSGSGIT